MAVPNDEPLPFIKLARERKGFGFDSSNTINYPIYLSDLSRLTGGNASGSGDSFLAVNQNNPDGQKPDGQNPLRVGEFKLYEQNLTRMPFYYVYSSVNSSSACIAAFPTGPYYHTDGDNLVPSNTGEFYAYTSETGVNPVASGYYAIYNSFLQSTGKWMYVGSAGLITQIGNC